MIPWTPSDDSIDDLWSDDDTVTGIPDLLSTMFAQQEKHMRVYDELQHTTPTADPSQYGNLDNPVIQAKIREHLGYTVEEMYEAVGMLKNKPWKQSFRELTDTQRTEFLDEIADAWHFFIELHILAGITPEDVFRHYFAMTAKNVERQTGGY